MHFAMHETSGLMHFAHACCSCILPQVACLKTWWRLSVPICGAVVRELVGVVGTAVADLVVSARWQAACPPSSLRLLV